MGVRDELKTMAEGFRWGRRPMVPRGVSPGWMTRAETPSAQADALTRKALDRVS